VLDLGYADFAECVFRELCTGEVRRISLLGTYVNTGKEKAEAAKSSSSRHLSSGRNGSRQPGSLLPYLALLQAEGFHHRRRDIGVVMHHLPSPAFTPVDVRRTPIDAYRLVSDLHLPMFGAQCVGHIVGYGNHH
jgi:hypothetical protein